MAMSQPDDGTVLDGGVIESTSQTDGCHPDVDFLDRPTPYYP